MNKQTRIPRPKGLTEIGHHMHKVKDIQDNEQPKQEFLNHILSHYINTGYKYCNQGYNIEQFHQATTIPIDIIHKRMLTIGKDIYGTLNPNEGKNEILRAVVGHLFSETLGDSNRALQQYHVLAAAQGHSYVPFVSGELNRAIKLKSEATGAMLQLYKSLAGTKDLSTLIHEDTQTLTGDKATTNYLTTDKALELMDAQKPIPLLDDADHKGALYLEHGIESMPEVNAHKQTGMDTSKEGLNFNQLAKVSEGLINDVDEDKPDSHIDRRAHQVGKDLDSDDI